MPYLPLLSVPVPHCPSPVQEIEGQKRAKRDRAEQAEEERHRRMLEEQIERAQKMARVEEDGGQDAGTTELRREELEAPLGFQLAAGRAAAAAGGGAAAAAEQQGRGGSGRPALVGLDEEDGGGGAVAAARGGKKSKIEELMEKVGGPVGVGTIERQEVRGRGVGTLWGLPMSGQEQRLRSAA